MEYDLTPHRARPAFKERIQVLYTPKIKLSRFVSKKLVLYIRFKTISDRRCQMPKYLFCGSYTPEGFKGLMEEGGSKRIEAAKQALGSVGGSLEAFYFSFGENDF